MNYTIKSLIYVSTTDIYLDYIGYMFRPVNRSSSGHQSNKSKVLLRYWDLVYVSTTDIYLDYIGHMFRPINRSSSGHQSNKSKVLLRYWDLNSTLDLFDWWLDDDLLTGRNM